MTLFPISVEVANSLLRSTNFVDKGSLYDTTFEKFLPRFRRYADWLQARIVRGTLKDGSPLIGWHSEHVGERGTVHLWETSQVVIYLMHYAALLKEHAARAALLRAGVAIKPSPARMVPKKPVAVTKSPPKGANPDSDPQKLAKKAAEPKVKDEDPSKLSPSKYWSQFVQSVKEPLARCAAVKAGSPYLALDQIGKAFVEPRSDSGGKKINYTLLLSGPPGTGKTTFCRDLAAALKFRFVTITVSDFLAGGAAEVEARAKSIFEVLNAQSNTVILLDEFDNFLLDRESSRYQTQQGIFQFMTPGMLTKLHDFRDQESSILVVATNYAERIDSAIKRQGRFDMQVAVLPPGKWTREQIFHAELLKFKLNDVPVSFASFDTPDRTEIVGATTLFSYGEISSTISSAFLDLASTATMADLRKHLVAAAKRARPAISLESYRTRIANYGRAEDRPDEAMPIEEFLMLVYLISEGGRPPAPSEKEAISEALTVLNQGAFPTTEALPELIKGVGEIRDDTVANAIVKAILTWDIKPKP